MKFIIESSAVPIYNRIATAFAKTLIEFGHIVHFINATEFNETDFVNTINAIEFDYYFTTNELNFIQKKSVSNDFFLFEKIQRKIIFIHHDNLFSAFHDLKYISDKIKALSNISQRSHHYCLEASNVELLKTSGIANAIKINHASEFTTPPNACEPEWGVTFTGHLMSSLYLYPAESLPAGLHLLSVAWNRFSHSSFAAQPQIERLSRDPYILESLGPDAPNNSLATQQFLIAGLNKFSSPIRGQLLSTIKKHRVDIFGGDLSYGRISDPLLTINQQNIFYQPHTNDYLEAANIYQKSKININISSLQFDCAINNRFIDIISSGGFLLTDKRDDMSVLGNLGDIISFETPEELNDKIDYFMNADKSKIENIIKEIQYVLLDNFNYRVLVNDILQFASNN